MAFTLWLSAEEERILEKIMRVEGTRNKEQAVIKAIRDKGASLAAADVMTSGPSGGAAAPARTLMVDQVTPAAADMPVLNTPTLDAPVVTG